MKLRRIGKIQEKNPELNSIDTLKYEDEAIEVIEDYVQREAEKKGLEATPLGVIANDGLEYIGFQIRGIPYLSIGDGFCYVLDNPFFQYDGIINLSKLDELVWEQDKKKAKEMDDVDVDTGMEVILEERFEYWATEEGVIDDD